MRHVHVSPFGAQIGPATSSCTSKPTTFSLWAPSEQSVSLQIGSDPGTRRVMRRDEGGWHRLTVDGAGPGTRYGYVVGDGGQVVPDPASRFNPDDVHGPSEVIDPLAYAWGDDAWTGRPWHDAAIYEMHVGTFTAEGTFAAAAERLEELRTLGVTAIELMPVADFPGARNWGYDGVLHFAPDATYGRPDDLKAFVDRAHGLGLMVFLDVVYNHFGPDGNYLHGYCPEFFNSDHQTPWGAAINFDGKLNEPVRAFYVHNALHWVEEYRFDGLRLDAVHAIADDTPRHIVTEIAQALRDGPGRERQVHLVLENERNQAHLLTARDGPPLLGATAQWNDDLHHAAHVLLTGEVDSYYTDYASDTPGMFAKALAEGFIYQGQPSAFRDGRPHGEPSVNLPSTAFVSCLQNHDQVGNRAFGDRLGGLADGDALEAAYACLLLSPHVPMLFMGEEFAASAPFLYFCDFDGPLAEAVTTGRRREFGHSAAFADEASQSRIPDPSAVSTFERSKLDWGESDRGLHARRRDWIRRLLTIRRERLVPLLAGGAGRGRHACDERFISVEWPLGVDGWWTLRANFGNRMATNRLASNAECVLARGTTTTPAGELALSPFGVWIGRTPA